MNNMKYDKIIYIIKVVIAGPQINVSTNRSREVKKYENMYISKNEISFHVYIAKRN